MKKIAIVGAGLAGLGAAYFACKAGFDVTIFDRSGIGSGASGVSTGLMHPFPGKTASISWNGFEAMEYSKRLLTEASRALGKDIASYSGIFRPAVTEEQVFDYQKNQTSKSLWTTKELPGGFVSRGLWISEGITVYSESYLQGLFLACKNMGATFEIKAFDEFTKFDAVILAAGAACSEFDIVKDVSFRSAIGQSLICQVNEPIPFSLASKGYITTSQDPHVCQVGSTYEHTLVPDSQKAVGLLSLVGKFYPPALDFKILEIRAGKRVSPKMGHRPIVTQITKNAFLFTGLGSRGMLYHAFCGNEVVELVKSL